MRHLLGLSAVALLGLTTPSWASGPCRSCEGHCIQPPPPACPDCSCPCDKGLHLCLPWQSGQAGKLIEQLCQGDCCDRVKAAEKLGCRLRADACCVPEVGPALVRALVCDPCWRVRRAAAWSLALQNARTEQVVLALYVASKLDPHYLVRDQAATALDVLLVCRRPCFKDVLTAGDDLVKRLRGKYKPGAPDCNLVLAECCGAGVPAVVIEEKP